MVRYAPRVIHTGSNISRERDDKMDDGGGVEPLLNRKRKKVPPFTEADWCWLVGERSLFLMVSE